MAAKVVAAVKKAAKEGFNEIVKEVLTKKFKKAVMKA